MTVGRLVTPNYSSRKAVSVIWVVLITIVVMNIVWKLQHLSQFILIIITDNWTIVFL